MNFLQTAKLSNFYFKKQPKQNIQNIIIFTIFFFLFSAIILFNSTIISTFLDKFSNEEKISITILPKDLDIGPLKISMPKLVGKGSLENKDIIYFKTLEEVVDVKPLYTLAIPTYIFGHLLGNSYRTDISISVMDSIFPKVTPKTNPWPCAINNRLLDMYNNAFAVSAGLPKISKNFIINKKFYLMLGENSLQSSSYVSKKIVKIKDFRSDVPILGITIPRQVLPQNLQQKLKITSILLKVSKVGDLPLLKKKLDKKGYKYQDSQQNLFSDIYRVLNKSLYLTYLPLIFIFLIILLVTYYQIKYMIFTKKYEIGIQLAMGMNSTTHKRIWMWHYLSLLIISAIIAPLTIYILVKLLLFLYDDLPFIKMLTINFNINFYIITTCLLILISVGYVKLIITKLLKNTTTIDLLKSEKG